MKTALREIVFDTETTGLSPEGGDRLVEIGAVELINHIPTGKTYHQYINPERSVPEEVVAVHGLTEEFLKDYPVFADVAQDFVDFVGEDGILVAHNASFDIKFVNFELKKLGKAEYQWDRVIDTLEIARQKFPGSKNNLDALCKRFNIDKEKGYAVAFDMNAINAVESGKLAGLLAPGNMVSALEGRGNYLPEATEKALSILKKNNPEGFFLMVEGSQIDSGAHGNNTNMVIAETIDFSKAVEKAFDFADKNPGTLVVVTADHETGGMTIPSQDEDFTQAESGIKCLFSTGGHTAVMVPVYAYGTGADNFTTIMENTDLPKKMIALLGLEW